MHCRVFAFSLGPMLVNAAVIQQCYLTSSARGAGSQTPNFLISVMTFKYSLLCCVFV